MRYEILSKPGKVIFFLWIILLNPINEMGGNRDSASRGDGGVIGEWTREG